MASAAARGEPLSGGAGGGLRWPNRRPHILTRGMRAAQKALAEFMPLIDWLRFDRRNVSEDLAVAGVRGGQIGPGRLARFACASADQALVYLLRRDTLGAEGRSNLEADPMTVSVVVPGLEAGNYRVTPWDTRSGQALPARIIHLAREERIEVPAFVAELMLAIRREEPYPAASP